MATSIVGTILEGNGWLAMARVVGADGQAVTSASISTLKYEVHRVRASTTLRMPSDNGIALAGPAEYVSGPHSLTLGDVWYDTLQTDDVWTVDDEGYNFAWTVPAAALPLAPISEYPNDRVYALSLKATPASGEPFGWQFIVTAKQYLYGKRT